MVINFEVDDYVTYHRKLHVVCKVERIIVFSAYDCMNLNNGNTVRFGSHKFKKAAALPSSWEEIKSEVGLHGRRQNFVNQMRKSLLTCNIAGFQAVPTWQQSREWNY